MKFEVLFGHSHSFEEIKSIFKVLTSLLEVNSKNKFWNISIFLEFVTGIVALLEWGKLMSNNRGEGIKTMQSIYN